jgi:hypothetical protein
MDYLELLDFISSLDLEVVGILFAKLASFVGTCRIVMKPITNFWIKRVNPYLDIRPTEKLLKHPLYKSVTFFLDYLVSAKAPQEKEVQQKRF